MLTKCLLTKCLTPCDSKVDIYHCVGKQQSVVVMLTDEDDSTTVMIFSGNFTMDDVMKMKK